MKAETQHAPLVHLAATVMENMSTAVLVFDEDMHLQALNPAAEALFGLSSRQVSGRTADEVFTGDERALRVLQRAAGGQSPMTERDLGLRVRNGEVISADCTATSINGSQGRVLLMEFVEQDRHKRITYEEQLRAQNEAAREMVRGLAHEIRNPLGGLRGAAQLLERELTEDGLREYTGVIIREADRLQNLLDRMVGPRSLPKRTWVNIHELTERVRVLIESEAGSGVRVERDYDPSLPEVYADADLLTQAILNVARNALQVLEGDGHLLLRTRIGRQFTIGNRCHRLVARIDVVDDGPGVPDGMLETIFYPMVTGRAEGTGLGLPIAQSLVGLHGGLIECASSQAKTTFSIFVPVEEVA
ncbi:MAG: PAS domain-containing sensor histidine kinase [Gammaproteobacteria bacterium]|nr:MAG: PAS domain-containing sensor histidine kinase [Gammaproteobacteria bacterium]